MPPTQKRPKKKQRIGAKSISLVRPRRSASPMAHSIVISPARPADHPQIQALAGPLFPNARPTFGPADHYIVARASSSLAGWAHLRLHERSVVLLGLAVDARHQRRGIGRALLLAALSWTSRARPGQPVALKVKASNAPALSLYLREGFVLAKDEGGVYLLRRAPPN